MKILSVVGARPNFIKISPFIRAINVHNKKCMSGQDKNEIEHILVHTGQHYDDNMSGSFFELLDIPKPDINLGIGSGTHAEQVGKTMIAFEKILKDEKPDWVIVVGDVNATLACSVTAKKEHVSVCHIEAGIRSGDIKMPEEVNRIVTDSISDLLLVPDEIAYSNLIKEGVNSKKVKLVGNIMIDSLEKHIGEARKMKLKDIIEENKLTSEKEYYPSKKNVVITLHRPSNVDEKTVLNGIVDFVIEDINSNYNIFWPVHPRALKMLTEYNLLDKLNKSENIYLLRPVNYLEMLNLNINTNLLFTDSGGLQEESTILQTPCVTMRMTTERPLTLIENGGTSILAGNSREKLKQSLSIFEEGKLQVNRHKLWDGNTAKRCLEEILNY